MYADAHVSKAASRINARTKRKPHVKSTGTAWFAACDSKQGTYASLHFSSTHSGQALSHQQTIVGVKFDDVGNGTQCHQIGKLIKPGATVCGVDTTTA